MNGEEDVLHDNLLIVSERKPAAVTAIIIARVRRAQEIILLNNTEYLYEFEYARKQPRRGMRIFSVFATAS